MALGKRTCQCNSLQVPNQRQKGELIQLKPWIIRGIVDVKAVSRPLSSLDRLKNRTASTTIKSPTKSWMRNNEHN